MTVASVTMRGRIAAEKTMLDACIVHRQGELLTDPETGAVTRSQSVVYEGKCKLQQTLAQSATAVAGEHEFTTQEICGRLPTSSCRRSGRSCPRVR
jgi:hypothetical protein